MHLLAAQAGAIDDGTEPVDLAQTPADVVILSAADTELAALSAAHAAVGGPSLRLASLMHLRHPMSVDLHLEACAARSRLVIARVLGGRGYWPYGVEQYAARLAEAGVPLALLPGDDRPDPELRDLSTVSAQDHDALWAYLVEGGAENAAGLLRHAAHMLDGAPRPPAARPVLRAGLHWPGLASPALDDLRARWPDGAPVVPVVFYRALLLGAGTEPVDRLAEALLARGLAPMPVAVASLKDPLSVATLHGLLERAPPDVILNATAFSSATAEAPSGPLGEPPANGAPVIQVVLSGSSEAAWAEGTAGLAARDVAMNVALPEIDGRLLSRAVSFKGEARLDAATQCSVATHRARPDRVAWTADLAAAWSRLRRTPAPRRRVALILANYPNRDGRLANGVGLDTPASTVAVLGRLAAEGHAVEGAPATAEALMARLLAGPTNWLPDRAAREGGERLPLADYRAWYARLPAPVRERVEARWGPPEADPFVIPAEGFEASSGAAASGAGRGSPAPSASGAAGPAGASRGPDASASRIAPREPEDEGEGRRARGARPPGAGVEAPDEGEDAGSAPLVRDEGRAARAAEGAFALSIHRFGGVVVGLQPARGYDVDPTETYHAPDLAPPHHYLAFHAWIRGAFDAHAVVHMGKHGNLEWLPGKALALSEECFPEVALGPVPNVYPFIVNDPGEGSQAKRRAAAVIVDHLTPPLTRAETYGPLRELEALLDEHAEAAALDPTRAGHLAREIATLCSATGLGEDAGLAGDGTDLQRIDAFLCELKEAQIRDGLHVLGASPEGRLERDLTAALLRVPRGEGRGPDASLTRALAADLELGLDPLSCDMAAPWTGPRPEALSGDDPWRTAGDTVERLETLALRLLDAQGGPASGGPRAGASTPGPPPDAEGAGHAAHGARATAANDAPAQGAPRPGLRAGASTPAPAPAASDPLRPGLRPGASPRPHAAPGPASAAVLRHAARAVRPAVAACGPAEMDALVAALDGRAIAPGPSGAPTRGRLDVLPTGRNFHSLDSRAVPTPAAWTLAWRSANLLIERHLRDHGDWPRALLLTAWGTSNMRTGGDDVAQALALMGARPTWDEARRRVTGYEIIPATALGRPRVDVTLRVSGFFRDAFPAQMDLIDGAARAIQALDEPAEVNPAAARAREGQSRARVYGSKPGAYGAGLQALIDERVWSERADLAAAYLEWGSYAYGGGASGTPDRAGLTQRLSQAEAVVQAQDNREHDILDSDDYYQFEGGAAAAVATLQGRDRPVYHLDHSRPERPVVRTLEEEIARVVRSRVVNPKWIAGCRRHGYKGAFEIAATVDYLFAFAATTNAVRGHHFDAVEEAVLADDDTRAFIEEANPAALREIARRLGEAVERGLWTPRSNSARARIEAHSRPATDPGGTAAPAPARRPVGAGERPAP